MSVKILRADPAQRKISLSLKAVTAQETVSAAEEEEVVEEVKHPRPRTKPLRGGIGEA